MMTSRTYALCTLTFSIAAAACGDAPADDGGGPDASSSAIARDASTLPPDAASPRDATPQGPTDSGTSFAWPDAAALDAAIRTDDAGLPSVPEGAAGEFKILTVDGLMVTVYLPPDDESGAVPLVFSLHGLAIPAVMMADVTGLPQLADKEGFVAVFPEGGGGSWNTGGSICGLGSFTTSSNDDLSYVEKIVAEVKKLRPIDDARIFMSGFSMGGYGTNNLACRRPDMFRAGAPAASGYPTSLCDPAPIPMLVMHGTSDGTISYDCGKQARDFWVQHNGCSSEVDVVSVTGGKCEWNRDCPADGRVGLCSFDGMGHGWAGSYNPFAFGGGPLYESATTLMWDFFKKQ